MNKPLRFARALSLIVLLAVFAASVAAQYEVEVQTDVKVVMRDGVELSTNLFIPKADGPFPAIIRRTPYNKGNEKYYEANYLASNGYVFVSQDCRGRFASEGDWTPFVNERTDGQDTQKWVLEQPWCDGDIGTVGGSYVGFTQWTVAPDAPNSYKALFSELPLIDPYHDVTYIGGAFGLSTGMGWGGQMSYKNGEDVQMRRWRPEQWDEALSTLPLSEWDKAIGRKVQYLRDWVAHTEYDYYWRALSPGDDLDRIDMPILAMGGWYDIFAKGVLDHTNAVKAYGNKNVHVIMGPWVHTMGTRAGDIDFGKAVEPSLYRLELQWFDHIIKGMDNEVANWPAYRIFVMGTNKWRAEQEWPLKRTKYTPYYFHSAGSANGSQGDGKMSTTKPAAEPKDSYVYDPEHPVPTMGGCTLFGCGAPFGARDQRRVEQRQDVLNYTSDELEQDLEVTGPVKAIIYVASDANDTDFTAKLVDVYPDGGAINICDGIIRARYREPDKVARLIEPGKVYEYEIDLWVTSNVFLAGHKIRVEISSSNFPRFDRNPNTGHAFGLDAEMVKASQTIYHDEARPSHILLPVIP